MVSIFASYCYLFLICSVLGYYLEGFWSLLTRGFFERHASTLWGPFCLIYGAGAIAVYWIYPKIKHNSWLFQWFVLTAAATLLEYAAHWGQEFFFQTYSWDYSQHFLNLQGRVSLPMSMLWGLLSIFFAHVFLPFYKKLSIHFQSSAHRLISLILAVIMLINVIQTFISVYLWTHDQIQVIAYLDDDTMEEKFPNMHFK